MNDKLLCCFNYSNNFYEIFADSDSRLFCKKIETNKTNTSISDSEIIGKVIDKIYEMKYKFFDEIKYKDEDLKLYLNLFNQKIYISKIDGEHEVVCDYKKYKELYDMYNNPIIYNYKSLINHEIFEGFNFQTDYSMEGFDHFTTNNNPFGNNPESNSGHSNFGFGSNPSSSYFGNSSSFGTVEDEEDDFLTRREKEREQERERIRKEQERKHKRNKRIIKVMIAGVLVTVIVFSSVALKTKFKNNDIDNYNQIQIEYVLSSEDQDVLQKILEALGDEDQWVKEQVTEQYLSMHGNVEEEAPKEEIKETTIKVSKETDQILESIKNNPNISNEEKEFIINNFTKFYEENSKYIKNIEEVCERFETLKIEYDIRSNADLEELGIRGEYNTQENDITIFSDEPSVKTHEYTHVAGNFGTGAADYRLNEGYTELLNPSPNKDKTYASEKTMVLILEQIYGKDFMRSAYFNNSLFSDMFDRFDLNKGTDINTHWNIIKDVNSFLVKYQHYSIDGLKQDEEAYAELKSLLLTLQNEYKEVTGKEWNDNELLKLCYDRFTGENTSDKHEGYEIQDIFFDNEGYKYTLGKHLSPQVITSDIKINDGEDSYVEFYSGSFDVSKDFDLNVDDMR